MLYDEDCWGKYPQYREFFNKMWVAEKMGYLSGPGGVRIPKSGMYCVRPIYNLDGMGKGTTIKYLVEGDSSTPPGYFWCEYFEGTQYSVDFARDESQNWYIKLAVEAGIDSKTKMFSCYKFSYWKKLGIEHYYKFKRPQLLDKIYNVDTVNVEYIDDKVVEIHLRGNPDFEGHSFTQLDVCWASDKKEYDASWTFIPSVERLEQDTRLGFYAK